MRAGGWPGEQGGGQGQVGRLLKTQGRSKKGLRSRTPIRNGNPGGRKQLQGRKVGGLSQKVGTLTGWDTFVLKAQLS